MLSFLRDLRRSEWDCVIDFQGLFRSGFCTYFAGNSKNTFGFADARELAPKFYDSGIVVPDESVHAVDKHIYLINQVLGTNESSLHPAFRDIPKLQADTDQVLRDNGLGPNPIAIAPCSRWASKTWPPAFFAAVIDLLADAGHTDVWLLGGPDETEIGAQVLDRAQRAKPVNLMGRTDLKVMVELLRRSRIALTNDSGPMHIAAAVGTPVVALFGPTSPAKTGPYGPNHRILQSQVACSPCMKRECPLPQQLCRDDVISPRRATDLILEILSSEA